jgi:hypothetical protein
MAPRGPNRKNPKYPEDFRNAVRDALAALGWKLVDWEDDDTVRYQDAGGEESTAGLGNLYRRCQRADRGEWPETITGFFTSISDPMRQGLSEKGLGEFADQLLVRVGVALDGTGHVRPWSRPLGDTGLVVNLVIDFPTSMAYVNESQIQESGRPAGAWLEQGLQNLHARTPEGALRVIDEESGVRVCDTGDSYDAARALVLDRLLPGNPNGFLVAVPHRELLIVLPPSVENLSRLPRLKQLAVEHHQDAPYAITDEVIWARGTTWETFPVSIDEDKVVLRPPMEFLTAFGMVTAGDGGEEGGGEEGPAAE